MSVAIRDHLPSIEEAKQVAGSSNVDQTMRSLIDGWLTSPDHQARIERHFDDLFGSSPWLFLAADEFDLIPYVAGSDTLAPPDLSTAGVYHLRKDVKPSCGGAPIAASAWWSDDPIMICPSAVSAAISFSGNVRCTDSQSATGIRHAACGCGPDQVICYPADQKGKAVAAVTREFANRGLHAYLQGWSWSELFGGNTFFGNRWLYHHYLYQQRLAVTNALPTTSQRNTLLSLPLSSGAEAAWPEGPERAGVATMPAFLRRFNNFRSRVRALSNTLLCKDIDSSLNTDGIATFVNKDLSAFDKAHGNHGDCAGCHFGMDNQGSVFLGWNDTGFYEAWSPRSQLGHAFGQTGTGPGFLMSGYTSRATGFNECMAKTTWESFTGASFDALAPSDKDKLLQSVAKGPKDAIRTVLTSAAMRQLRAPAATGGSGISSSWDFTADIAPVLQRSCSGAACHDAGNPRGAKSAYVNNATTFKQADAARLVSGSMPPTGAGKTLTDEERQKLIDYIRQ